MTYMSNIKNEGGNIYKLPKDTNLTIPGLIEHNSINYSAGNLQPPETNPLYRANNNGRLEKPRYDIQENSHLSHVLPTDRYHFNFRIYI